ncbi:MBL fold metallo-hydrolase [Membranihabitans maritimus]|uniref:MBL fold metallo-hydrolase n=1 Tax=Membranihabitans maritimus TaxID=2904244 RepID=UPI001F2139BB|nr:MBL fold metallo-hydrolase [Membranihabitans maritimus]
MKFQLWRNATVLLNIDTATFLIDPMLGPKASFGVFPWTNDTRPNPLIDLPFPRSELKKQISKIDAIVVTHLHPDHWDSDAISLLDKNLPVIGPSIIADSLAGYGFTNIQSVDRSVKVKGIDITLTHGRHGIGEIEEKMGVVHGFYFSSGSESIFFAGDTIWCDEVKSAISIHQPKYVVVAGGAATFAIGDPVTMTARQICKLCHTFPEVKVLVTHLEAVSPCTEDREFTGREIATAGISDRCIIPEDGEQLVLFSEPV